jgi:hypothetical protein
MSATCHLPCAGEATRPICGHFDVLITGYVGSQPVLDVSGLWGLSIPQRRSSYGEQRVADAPQSDGKTSVGDDTAVLGWSEGWERHR